MQFVVEILVGRWGYAILYTPKNLPSRKWASAAQKGKKLPSGGAPSAACFFGYFLFFELAPQQILLFWPRSGDFFLGGIHRFTLHHVCP